MPGVIRAVPFNSQQKLILIMDQEIIAQVLSLSEAIKIIEEKRKELSDIEVFELDFDDYKSFINCLPISACNEIENEVKTLILNHLKKYSDQLQQKSLQSMNAVQKLLQDHKNKTVRIHACSQTYTGILTATPSTLCWEVQPENPYIVIKFMEDDIYCWDIICKDLVLEIYLKRK